MARPLQCGRSTNQVYEYEKLPRLVPTRPSPATFSKRGKGLNACRGGGPGHLRFAPGRDDAIQSFLSRQGKGTWLHHQAGDTEAAGRPIPAQKLTAIFTKS